MEENRYDYDLEDGYDYENEAKEAVKKSLLGYRIVIILLVIILAGVSALYFNINRQQNRDMELMAVDRDSIQSNLSSLITEYDSLKFKNDTISAQLVKANEMMEQLKKERRWNYAKIKAYQKEVGTLRAVMKNYIRQIDSLNSLNKKLITENVEVRKGKREAEKRADMAEEKANELANKVRQGSVLYARDISVIALNANDREVSRVKRASTLRVDFTIGANELASAGNRSVYMCLTSPDGYLLQTDAMPTFTYQGSKKSYTASREVDYQNEDIDVSIYYRGSGFIPGVYKVEIYMNGSRIGKAEVVLQ